MLNTLFWMKVGKYIPYFSKFQNIFQSKMNKYDVRRFFTAKHSATSNLLMCFWAVEQQADVHLSINPDWKTRQPVTEESTAPVRAKPSDKNIGCWFLKYTFTIAHQPWSEGGTASRRRWRRRRRGKSWSWPSPPARSQRCAVPSLEGVLGGMLTP